MLILVSGGIDSAACIAFYHSRGAAISGLHIDYGQIAARREFKAAKQVCAHYGVQVQRLTWSGGGKKKDGEIRGRNAFFLYAALMEFDSPSGIIALGVHAGTPYIDCSPGFIISLQSTFDAYTNGRIRIGVPFLGWNKQDIWHYCQEKRVPLKHTYSCEKGCVPPCGRCLSCRDREALYALPKHND